ncbi:hypothetical protein [Actinocorallia libanotica]|uniref:Ig-like domain-containing protein n=1 Tax=Actinocorallia libanotica TaxID=46162 RepID=A0ABP4C165_9ACTN
MIRRSRRAAALGSAAVLLATAGVLVAVEPGEPSPRAAPAPALAATPVAARSALQLSGLTLDTGRVYGGHRARATVTFSRKAPVRLTVRVTASGLKAPARVRIAKGSRTASFWLGTSKVAEKRTGTVRVSYGKRRISRKLAVLPLPVLRSLSLSTASIAPGGSAVGTVRLSAPAQPGGSRVSLSGGGAEVTVPRTVRIPQGVRSASFRVTAANGASPGTVTLSARRGTVTRKASLRIERPRAQPQPSPAPHHPSPHPSPTHPPATHPPAPPRPSQTATPGPSTPPSNTPQPPERARVSGLLIDPDVLHFEGTATGTLTLDRPAPEGGTAVTLVLAPDSTEGQVDFPAALTVPAGRSSADFTVTNKLAASGPPLSSADIEASAGGATVRARATLMGRLRLMSMDIPAATVTGRETQQGRLWVMGDNTTSARVLITFAGNVAIDPIQVVIPAGREEAVFPFTWTAPDVETPTRVWISASGPGASFDRTVLIQPHPDTLVPHLESITLSPPLGRQGGASVTTVTVTLTKRAHRPVPVKVTGTCFIVQHGSPDIVIPEGGRSVSFAMNSTCYNENRSAYTISFTVTAADGSAAFTHPN